jgi:hypothetical protein
VVFELGTQDPVLNAADRRLVVRVRSLLKRVLRCRVMTVREVRCSVLVNVSPVLTVSMVESEWAGRLVDRDLIVVDSKTTDLGVLVGEVPPGQQWVVGEVNSRDDL